MNKLFLISNLVFTLSYATAQSFAPAPGEPGSTAIYKDSSSIIAWATGIDVQRGLRDIADLSAGFASFGDPENGLYEAEGNPTAVVSLGDGGVATLTFDLPIQNEPGPDFAVFENGFADHYMELAFVEVSSDGFHFVRFPAVSEVPMDVQVGPFSYSDCRMVHNLAGKYRQGYGTPFDLEDLTDSAGIDLNAITHVRLIDVVGSIDPQYGTFDSNGTIINDNYPTAFESGGFDLDAVGVIHQAGNVGLSESSLVVEMWPNPTSDELNISTSAPHTIQVIDALGRVIYTGTDATKRILHLKEYASSFVYVHIRTTDQTVVRKVVVR